MVQHKGRKSCVILTNSVHHYPWPDVVSEFTKTRVGDGRFYCYSTMLSQNGIYDSHSVPVYSSDRGGGLNSVNRVCWCLLREAATCPVSGFLYIFFSG